jgi:DNA-binding MarR family transcriptional regulator
MELINPTDCPYYLISRTTLVGTSALKRGFAAAGVEQVRPAYIGVLMSLWREDGLNMTELGRRAGLEPSTMTGLLDRMERDGLLYRSADPGDRRALRVYLTEEGVHIQGTVLGVLEQVIAKIFSGISEEDLGHLKGILRRVLENSR